MCFEFIVGSNLFAIFYQQPTSFLVVYEEKSPYSYQPFWTENYKWSEVPLFPPAILDGELQMK